MDYHNGNKMIAYIAGKMFEVDASEDPVVDDEIEEAFGLTMRPGVA